VIEDIIDEELNYRNARGINIYINGQLIDNGNIIDYNFNQGLIKLSNILKINDDIKITYLEKLDGFLCPYPRLDRYTLEDMSFRLYIRPSYPNITFVHPGDDIERVCYQLMEDAAPSGELKSCLTDEPVQTWLPSGVLEYYVPSSPV